MRPAAGLMAGVWQARTESPERRLDARGTSCQAYRRNLMLHSDQLLHHNLSRHHRGTVDGTEIPEGSRGSELPHVSPARLRQ